MLILLQMLLLDKGSIEIEILLHGLKVVVRITVELLSKVCYLLCKRDEFSQVLSVSDRWDPLDLV